MKNLNCKQQIVLLCKKWMNLSTSILNILYINIYTNVMLIN